MTNTFQSKDVNGQAAAREMRGQIEQKWGRFDAQEIAALKDNDDLVTQLQAKYQLDKAKAQTDVDAFANGRQL